MKPNMPNESNSETSEVALLAYAPPELTVYNHSIITLGGTPVSGIVGDFTPGGGTSYKAS